MNPALYIYRNKSYRKAALKLLRFGKPLENQLLAHIGRRARRHRGSVVSIDVGELIDSERAPRLRRSKSYAAEAHGLRKTRRGVSPDRVKDRRMSTPPLTSRDNLSDAQQPVNVTVQIKHAPRKKPVKKKKKLSNHDNSSEKSHLRRMTGSKSLNEDAFAMATSARQTIAKVNSQRRNSAPSALAIESAPRKKLVKKNKNFSNDGSKRQT